MTSQSIAAQHLPPSYPSSSTALYTDRYELTMIQAAQAAGTASRHSFFELFARKLPDGRRYGVVSGVGRALEAIENFHFTPSQLDFIEQNKIVTSTETLQWLSEYRFMGNIWGYAEGEVYFPNSPICIVEGSFAEAVVLETVLLSIYNHDSAIASAASRMVQAAHNRPCIEMGSRRTHELAAVAAARAAYIAGFVSTSNLAAGMEYAIPTTGTAAHSFTLLHDSETDAFQAQLNSLGNDTTLLVDTYDIKTAITIAVELTHGELGAIRIDSGDLARAAFDARRQLDSLGAHKTKIIVTSDLDEWTIAGLSSAPIDGYGVGTSVVTGSGHPTCGFVYKLVSRAADSRPDSFMTQVAKKSQNKSSIGGRKFAVRRLQSDGIADAEVIGIDLRPDPDNAQLDSNDRQLQVPLVQDGKRVYHENLQDARERHIAALGELPLDAQKLSRGEPVIPTVFIEKS